MSRSWLPPGAVLGLLLTLTARADDRPALPIVVESPDRRVVATVTTEGEADRAEPRLAVTYRGRPVLLPSRLGVDLVDEPAIGVGSSIQAVETREVRETYRQFPGKRREVIDHHREASIRLHDRIGSDVCPWELVVRVSDDGVAFRYGFLGKSGANDIRIAGERTQFRLPDDARCVAMPVKSFTTPHEDLYVQMPVADLAPDGLIGLPLLALLPGTGSAAILEARWTDYAGLYLARDAQAGTALNARLSTTPGEPGVSVRAKLPHQSPWRAVMVGESPGRLVESDLALNLNDPCEIADTSWIKPGKTTFPWWNGFYEEPGQIPQKLDTATAKYYIDFCARAGIPYHSLDGVHEVAWYGGPLQPWQGSDIRQGGAGLDLPEVVRYGKSKGVGIRLWLNWRATEALMDLAFPVYEILGVEGVMVDLIDRDDQAISRFVPRLVATAARHHLTVTIHNIKEPTGLERTYPNLLTSEAVRNLEFNKWDPIGVPPEHEATVPFTRMLAGPLDFHQGSFRGVPVEKFRPRDKAPVVIGTPCRMLASYVVFQDHLSMVADYPSAYRDHPALPILVSIPSTWDDTRFLTGEVGQFVAIARRAGNTWWVGAMTDRTGRNVAIPLRFLGPGSYRATVHQDQANPDPAGPAQFRTETVNADATSTLPITLMPSGGALIRIDPTEDTTR